MVYIHTYKLTITYENSICHESLLDVKNDQLLNSVINLFKKYST